jgi:hypothetical protein
MTPRVQTFGWRLLQKAMPTGARAGKYTNHIPKTCCRYDFEENEKHLFFTCSFARASWFSEPWYIRTDILTANTDSITQIILRLLNINHPNANISNILTFMWCTWKSINDCLFNRKENLPTQVHHMANAINKNLKMVDVVQILKSNRLKAQDQDNMNEEEEGIREEIMKLGETIKSDLAIKGNRLYSDTAWKTKEATETHENIHTGLGIFGQI